MNFGERLRALRKEHNLGQKELADHLNVSISTISNYENNIHFPDPDMLCKFADYFQVSIDYILGRTKFRYGLDVLNLNFNNGTSMGELINVIVRLETQKQQDICDYVKYVAQR